MLFEIVLWNLGFLLLIYVALYAASAIRKDKNAADRILKKRRLKSAYSVDDIAFDVENALKNR